MTQTIFIIFGATGNLMHRKLIPAFKRLYEQGNLGDTFRILGVAGEPENDEVFRERVRVSLRESSNEEHIDDDFIDRFYYNQMDFNDPNGYGYVKERLNGWSDEETEYVVYLAVPPRYFTTVLEGLVHSGVHEKGDLRRKIVFEKPFGHDLSSARDLNAQIRTYATESQIYRIDHYLGKDAVQDFMVLRFANSLFEPIWNREYIDNVQITAYETAGVGHRSGYYEQAGALQDMVQSHLFQMLSLIAMEPPVSLDADAIRDEKVKVFRSIKDFGEDFRHDVVFGQYTAGRENGEEIPGYREEQGVKPDSMTDTFTALRLGIDNWRWSGVPFYLRTGKRMDRNETVIVITFKQVPRLLYNHDCGMSPNKLVIRIQPQESIQLEFNVRRPGLETKVHPVSATFDHKTYFGLNSPEAYEVLFLEIMKGDQTLFTRADGVEASWQIIESLVQCRQCTELHFYNAGSVGPDAAHALLKRDGRRWYEY